MLHKNKIYLVTGSAGFIGYFLSKHLLQQECVVIGIDNMNNYYDVGLKEDRLSQLNQFTQFTFIQGDIADKDFLLGIFEKYKPNIVVNLAAQAGVRYSIENPDVYIQSNISGFFNVLEGCRYYPVDHLIYASSSSIYGANNKVPFEETDSVDFPVSLYAATKKSNELMAYTYSHLYHIPTTGLRFFTVYGPYGRPDMAYFDFVNKFFKKEPIKIFNNGDFENDLYRDFTYIDDIIEGILRLIPIPPVKMNRVEYRVCNIGNNQPEKLMHFVETLERALSNALGHDAKFHKIYEPMKAGDVPITYASTDKLEEIIGFKPKTSIEQGLQQFVDWYVEYYKKK